MSDTTTSGTVTPEPTAKGTGPVRNEHGRLVYDATYDPADGDKYDDDSHLQGLDDTTD